MTSLPLALDAAHPAFVGHFPSRPVVPGVVLLDESLRAIIAAFGIDQETIASTICKIGSAKFLSPVGPGEALRIEVDATTGPAGGIDETTDAHAVVAATRYALRVIVGTAANERIAVTGSVSFEPRAAHGSSTHGSSL